MNLCKNCHAGCCRRDELYITVLDFLEFVNQLGLEKASRSVKFEPSFEQSPDYLFPSQDRIYPFVFDDVLDQTATYFYLSLKKEHSKLLESSQKCIFLEEYLDENKNIRAHCTINDFKPYACRAYPFTFDSKKSKSFLIRPQESPKAKENLAYKLCPKDTLEFNDFEINSSGSLLQQSNLNLLTYQRIKVHNQLAINWNSLHSKKRTRRNIVNYFLATGDNLILQEVKKVNHQPEESQGEFLPRTDLALEALQRIEDKKDPGS